ncbi:BspA family leucine-rich repeat surface protein [Listeria monocytogenes]|nr:BspA family leucine-rich repeat surface protein [Listeria monocytogenes]ECB9705992.1 BspA family leucine-rich repeat surface protein [Listeria monocytogenes]ECB9830496.1 BspA family leucine-rich repeat surface protein [Listeria monocytogenes]
MKNRKKRLRQLIVAFVLLYTIGLPIKNIVLANANEVATNEAVVPEETELKEDMTAETDTSNSENMENEISTADEAESVILDESTQTSKEISSSETVLEKRGILTDTSDVNSSEKTEASSANQQSEERSSTKAITSGTFPNSSTATWNFDDTTGTLTISGGTLVNPGEGWDGNCYLETLTGVAGYEITNVVLEGKVFASGNCDGLFSLLTARSPSLDLSNFDTSNVTSMQSMFYANYAASIDVSNWDTSQVTSMFGMFEESAATSLDVSSFDTSKVTDMGGMFYESAATSLDVSSFDTSNVMVMSDMFAYSAATSLDVSNFDTSNVTWMSGMFAESAATSLDLSNFDTSKVRNMYYMFFESAATSLDLSSFDTSKVTDMRNLFVGASQLQNLTLGSQVQFLGVGAFLPDPTPTAKYTGKWQNVGSGTVDKPKGSFVGTGMELISMYDGSTMADTYVWQPTLLEVNVQDSILMIGDTWNPEDNFLDATDTAGNPVDVNAITVTGSVDTTQPGVYTATYSYGGITSTATITVLEMMPASWINFFVDGTNIKSIPGSLLSTPEWDLTTGLWDKWNPWAIKVPTDKIPLEPIKQGYVFKGWKDNTGKIVDFKTLDLDLNSQNEFNFYAVFEKVNSTNPSVEPPAKPGEGPNVVSPSTPGSGGNQTLSNGSGSNTGNMTITSLGNTTMTSQGNTATASSVTSSQGGKLAKLGENSSLLLQGFGLMLVLSGTIFFLFKRKNTRY